MKIDFGNVTHVEFGVGRDDGQEQAFHAVMVDGDVQDALKEMAVTTWEDMQSLEQAPPEYQPSEKYESREYIILSLQSDLVARLKELHEAVNLDLDQQVLHDPDKVFCYFAKIKDTQGRTVTALKRATYFKGVLKSRLVSAFGGSDALKIVEDKVFKLDRDFDLIIDDEKIHILHPSGFEFAGQLQEAILASVDGNIDALRNDLGFVNLDNVQEYVRTRPRAARYLASIRSQQEIARVDRDHLVQACRSTGVQIQEGEKIVVEDRDIMGFLEVLDRRRYEVKLVPDEPEQFRAASRRQIGGK